MNIREEAIHLRAKEMQSEESIIRKYQERVRDEVHEAPSRVTMLNALLNAAQSLRMDQSEIDRLIVLRAHHNNRYNQHTTDLGLMVERKGAGWIKDLIVKYEAELTPDKGADND